MSFLHNGARGRGREAHVIEDCFLKKKILSGKANVRNRNYVQLTKDVLIRDSIKDYSPRKELLSATKE
jgi:hypothetical protein